MVRIPSKPRVFEERQIPTADNDFLYAKLMFPKPPVEAKRLVLIPPLIGASPSQSLIVFRQFAQRGAVIVSFEYRGHPRSTGVFELDKTIVDTHHAMLWATDYAHEHGLPLHGFSTCYGVATLLAQFKKGHFSFGLCGADDTALRCPFWSISGVSGLFSLDRIIRFENFMPILGRNLGMELNRETFLRGIDENIFDWDGDAFKDSLFEFLTGLFPDLRIGRDYFEELSHDKVNLGNTLKQLLLARYLEDLYVPPQMPCNFFYGCRDDVLLLETPQGRQSYCERAKSLIPHIEMHERDLDHFGRGPDRHPMIEQLADMFEEAESRAVPLEIQDKNIQAKNTQNREIASEDIQQDVR